MSISPAAYRERYDRWTAPLRARPGTVVRLNCANRLLTALFYVAYLVLGAVLVLRGTPAALVPLAAVPGVGFAVLSLLRRRFDCPRPYEVCGIEPLISREGSGRSFPSRHAFSAAVIALAWASTSPVAAACLLACTAALAWCRVLGGVHFPRDVVVGALAGTLVGVLTSVCIALVG